MSLSGNMAKRGGVAEPDDEKPGAGPGMAEFAPG